MKKNNTATIRIKDLNWKYGNTAILENINIDIKRGKFYSIIGPNGSGKTTLLKNILRHLEPKRNTLFIEDLDISSLSYKEIAKKMGCVPQNTLIDYDFSALDIVMMGRTPHLKRFETESEKDLNICREAMIMTDTWRFKDKLIQNLSGGERQRVIVARAIAQKPDILLLDEPISHLDIQHQIELLDTVAYINKKSGTTVIVVLHDLNLAAQYSDEIFLLSDGKVLSYGSPMEVINEDIIKEVYKTKVCIIPHPVSGKPHVIPISTEREVRNYETI